RRGEDEPIRRQPAFVEPLPEPLADLLQQPEEVWRDERGRVFEGTDDVVLGVHEGGEAALGDEGVDLGDGRDAGDAEVLAAVEVDLVGWRPRAAEGGLLVVGGRGEALEAGARPAERGLERVERGGRAFAGGHGDGRGGRRLGLPSQQPPRRDAGRDAEDDEGDGEGGAHRRLFDGLYDAAGDGRARAAVGLGVEVVLSFVDDEDAADDGGGAVEADVGEDAVHPGAALRGADVAEVAGVVERTGVLGIAVGRAGGVEVAARIRLGAGGGFEDGDAVEPLVQPLGAQLDTDARVVAHEPRRAPHAAAADGQEFDARGVGLPERTGLCVVRRRRPSGWGWRRGLLARTAGEGEQEDERGEAHHDGGRRSPGYGRGAGGFLRG